MSINVIFGIKYVFYLNNHLKALSGLNLFKFNINTNFTQH
jgi:hypothetical protein